MKFTYEHYTLPNGLQILLIPSKSVYTVTVSAWIKTGSAHESPENNGITHFVEHVALTATKTWPTKEMLNEKLEFSGAEYNGSTSKEYLKYYINVPYTKIEFGISYIYEILYKTTFNEEYIEKQRSIIMDEISKRQDNIGYHIDRFLIENYSQNKSAYSLDVAGTSENVSKFTKEDLLNHYNSVHSPNKILLSVVGNFDIKSVIKQLNDVFGNVQKTSDLQTFPEDKTLSNIICTKPSSKTNLVVSGVVFPSLGQKDIDRVEISLTSLVFAMLSGPMSSRLKYRLREKEGLLYTISASRSAYETYGTSIVSYEIPKPLFEKTFDIVVEELENFYLNGITEKELAHFKEYAINSNLSEFDNVFAYSTLIRTPIILGKEVLELDELNKKIRETDITTLNKLIKKYFDIEKIGAFAFGEVDNNIENTMKKSLSKFMTNHD